MANVTTNIDFFGFTGENTLGDIREYFEKYPDDLTVIQERIENQQDWYHKAIAEAVFYFALDNYPKNHSELNKEIDFSDSNKDRIVSINPCLKELFGANALNTADKYNNPSSNRKDDDKFQKDIDETLITKFSKTTQGKTDIYKKISKYAKECIAKRMLPIYDERLHNIKSEIEKTEKPRKQFVFTGAPGTGKTFGVKAFAKAYIESKGGDAEKQFKFVQFHSSYDYTDFVEGLKPAVIGHNADGEPVTSFVRMDGVFKKFCRKADNDKDKLYFFIIDEINRADLSRVFGELMYCLEESYRGEGNKIDTQYQNLPAYEYKDNSDTATPMANDIFAQGFYIPENVVIIGTMNDIDRSVETFDFALRRRFRWINITAEESLAILDERLKNKDKDLTELKRKINALNGEIKSEDRLGEDFQLGQSYFANMTKQDIDDSNNYFESELLPILKEYVRGRNTEKINEFIEACGKAFIGDTYVYPK